MNAGSVREGIWYLATFGGGDWRYRWMAHRLALQARGLPEFVPVPVTDLTLPRFIGSAAAAEVKRFAATESRGFGCMLWKPLLIQALLHRVDTAGVLFVDAGCELDPSQPARTRLREWIAESERVGHRLWAVEGEWSESMYTKQALLDEVPLAPDALASRQIQSGVAIFAKRPSSVELVDHWAELSWANGHILLQDPPNRANERETFVAHRHDQSILSVLAKAYGLAVQPNETHPSAAAVISEPGTYPILTVRNRRLLPRRAPQSLRDVEELAFRLGRRVRKVSDDDRV